MKWSLQSSDLGTDSSSGAAFLMKQETKELKYHILREVLNILIAQGLESFPAGLVLMNRSHEGPQDRFITTCEDSSVNKLKERNSIHEN